MNTFAERAFEFIYVDKLLVYFRDGLYPDQEALDSIKMSYVNFFEELAGEINVMLFIKFYGGLDAYFKAVSYVFDHKVLTNKILKMKREKQLKGEVDIK